MIQATGKTNKKTVTITIIVLIATSCLIPTLTQTAKAQQTPNEPTLAQTINTILNAVNWNQSNSWTALYGNIFCRQNMTAFDDAISRDVAAGDLLDALFVTRLAELNNYTSPVIEAKTRQALETMAMVGSLPETTKVLTHDDVFNRLFFKGAFLLYHRYLLYCYPYAETEALTEKWNMTQAYSDFKKAYLRNGEMLWINPAENWSESYSSRYFDEHAETMSMFLLFADLGFPEALEFAADAWEKVQVHWNGKYYGYTDNSTVECEMANFAQIAAAYRERNGGSIPYWDRVLEDLNYKLLAHGWNSSGWAQPGVIVHATNNPQLRLWETTSAIIALHQLYPYLTDEMAASYNQLLIGDKPAWKGLINSSLNVNGSFIGAGGDAPSIDATLDAAATLFLEGIVPISGSLSIPIRNEAYQDCRTPLSVQYFRFDYTNHSITIPVNAGAFTFIYGSSPVNCTFARNGIYTVHFSDDWNQIIYAKYVGPINLTVIVNGAPTLSWTDGASANTQYTILRGTSVDSETPIAKTNSTTYVDSTAANGNIYYYRVEAANQTSADVSVVYDYAPVISADYHGGWHTSDFTVKLSATQGGNAKICYKINNGEAKTVGADGQPQITTEGAGNCLEYWSTSPLGTSQSMHYFVRDLKLDKTAPNVSVCINDGAENTTDPAVTLAINASDISEVIQMRFSAEEGEWSSWMPYEAEKCINLTGGVGVKRVLIEVQNGAGLTSKSSSIITLLDSEPSSTNEPTPSGVNQPAAQDYSYLVLLIAITGAVLAAALLLRQKAVTNPKKHSAHIAP